MAFDSHIGALPTRALQGTSHYERWIYACGTAEEITAVFVDSAITVNVARQPASAGEVKLWMDGEEIPLAAGGNTLEYGDTISLEGCRCRGVHLSIIG